MIGNFSKLSKLPSNLFIIFFKYRSILSLSKHFIPKSQVHEIEYENLVYKLFVLKGAFFFLL